MTTTASSLTTTTPEATPAPAVEGAAPAPTPEPTPVITPMPKAEGEIVLSFLGSLISCFIARHELKGMNGDIAGYGILWGELMGIVGLLI